MTIDLLYACLDLTCASPRPCSRTVGKQRAFVVGMLALSEGERENLPPRAFADLVICMHHQRTHTATLSAMLDNAAPSELHELIRHALRFDSHELAPVVARLELDFDIGAVASSLSLRRCWDLYTAHIDKLRVCETTLLQSIEHHAQRAEGRSTVRNGAPAAIPAAVAGGALAAPALEDSAGSASESEPASVQALRRRAARVLVEQTEDDASTNAPCTHPSVRSSVASRSSGN